MTDYFMTADEVASAYGVDLITAETLRNRLIEITRQMWGMLLRSSFSNIIRDGMDFGVCVHLVEDDDTTELVAITEGCTQFAFTHQHMTNMVLDEYGVENLGPGDTLVSNDSFRGGIHAADLNFFRVVHDDDGRPAFVLSDAAHVLDVGGSVPGGLNNSCTSLYEEGLRIPPMLITSGDVIVRSTANLILENGRLPLHMIGDVRALLGTLKAGEERLRAVAERDGFFAVKAAARYALGLAERRMRRALMTLENGEWSAQRYLDDDGVELAPVRISVTVRKRGAEAEIDFSGTARQGAGPLTTCWEEASRALIGPKMILDPHHPMNAGAMRPFQVLLPAGSTVLGLPPTSSSNHMEVGATVASLMLEVFSQAHPKNAVTPDAGTSGACMATGIDTRPGYGEMPFGTVLIFGEAWGGTQVSDGISFCLSPLFNCRSIVIERVEKETPLVVWEYGIVVDSAGAGRYRGGFSPSYAVEALSDTSLTPVLDGARFAPQGSHGGGAGVPSYGMLVERRDGEGIASWNGVLPAERLTPLFGIWDEQGRPDPVNGAFGLGTVFQTCKLTAYPLKQGQVIRFQVATPGGYGDPLTRDPEAVLRDVANERVSLDQALTTYGVVIDASELSIDEGATRELRSSLSRDPAHVTPPAFFRAWPATREEFDHLHDRLPPGARLPVEW
jgi:N-methylhydantoinase B